MNEKKIIISLLAVILCLNVAYGMILVLQQKKLNSLSKSEITNNIADQNKSEVIETSDELKAKILDTQLQDLVADQKQIIGTIKSISNNSITIIAAVPNYDDLKGKDLTQSYSVNVENKEIKVNVDANTQYESDTKADLREGKVVTVVSEDSVVGKTELTAKEIIVSNDKASDVKIDPEYKATVIDKKLRVTETK